LLETALVTLMALGQPSAGPVLFDLVRHRRPEIRVRAIEAIAAVQPPEAQGPLVTALSDGNADVRTAAATALGEIGAAGALEPLFLALDHGNMSASLAIGRAVPSRDAGRLASYLGKIPFHSLGPALGEVIKRNDVTESEKLALVARLEEVGTGEVKSFFNDLMAATSGSLSPAVSRAILRAIQEIVDR
jgi:HEAT repeat protein